MADGYISQIKTPDNKVYDFRDQHLKVYTGSCTTAAATAIKDVTTDGNFKLEKGAVVFVNFSTTNTVAVADLKLRINSNASADAKPLKHQYNASESNLPGVGYIRANQTYVFYYDGTNWVMITNYNSNNNDVGYYILTNGFRLTVGTNKIPRQTLFARIANGNYESFTITANTVANTKTKNTNGFLPEGKIYWNSSNTDYAAGAQAFSAYEQYHSIDYRYTFNLANITSIPANAQTYVKWTYADGLLYLADEWFTTTLPTTDDGFIYQRIGSNYYGSADYRASLLLNNPYYIYKDGGLQVWHPTHLSAITGADDLKAIEAISGTSGLLKKTAANTWTLDTTSYLPLSGGTITGTTASTSTSTGALIVSGGVGIGGRVTAQEFNATRQMVLSAGKVYSNISGSNVLLPAKTTTMYANGIAIANPGLTVANDVGWIRVLGSAETDMILEIATGDDGGAGEQIVVRQYNTSNAIAHEAVLLSKTGASSFPVSITTPALIGSSSIWALNTANNTAGLVIGIETQSYKFGLHMGSGGTNHGLYDWHKNGTGSAAWILLADENNNWTFTGNASTATTATTATWTGQGKHTAAITANEFTPEVGTMTILGNVSSTTMAHTNNANAEMIIKAHPSSGTNYYEARLGFSSNGKLYYMPVNTSNWTTIAYTSDIPTNLNQLTNGPGYVTSSGITSVTIGATSPVQSSTSTAQTGSSASTTISLKDAYGDTKNPYGAKATNLVLAGPSSGNNAAPTFRALVAADIPNSILKWQTTTEESTALYDFGVYVNMNNANGSSMSGGNYFNILNVPYRKASGNTKADWGWQLGNATANDGRLWYRTSGDNVWGDWQTIAHATQSSSDIGSSSQPVYMTKTGVITVITAVGAAYGGTGKTTLKDSANTLINALDTGSSPLTANDYVITQYVGGGTTTTTYHRRPASQVVNGTLVKAALGTNSTHGNTFLRKDGTWQTPPYPVTSVATLTGAIAASDLVTQLGLSKAMNFLGVATVAITDGGTEDPKIGGNATTVKAGDVVIDSSSAREYVWSTTGKWELLGGDSSYWVSSTGTTGQFWRGDNSWSNEISGGILKITASSNTLSIGSQNSSFTHIYNSASIPFIFNNTVLTVSGNLGNTTYPFNNLYIGKTSNRSIYYVGTKVTNAMITFLDNTADAYGNGIKIGGGGVVVVGAGESAASLSVTPNLEALYLTADGVINIEAGGDTIANRVGMQITTAGHVIPVKAEAAHSNAQNLGASDNKWANVYATTFIGNLTGNATSADSAKWLMNRGGSTVTISDGPWAHGQTGHGGTNAATVWHQRWKQSGLTYTPSGGSATTLTDSGDMVLWLAQSSTANTLTVNMAIDGLIYAIGGFKGNLNGQASTVARATFGDVNNGEHNANNIKSNGMWYYTSNGPITALGASTADGAIYSQAYSTYWAGQIAQDYRDGALFVRGLKNGAWQNWYAIPKFTTTTGGLGNTTQPVYIDTNGELQVCTAYDSASVNYATSAGSATTATHANYLTGFSSRSTAMAWGNQTGSVITCFATPKGGGWGFRDDNPAAGQVSMTIDGTIYIKEGGVNIANAVKSFSVSGQTVTYTNLWGNTGTFTTQDTKNTAGSTNSDSKLYLIGATSQDANPQTYSDAHVFETNGALSAKTLGVNADTDSNKVTLQYNSSDSSLEFVFA